MIRIDSSWSFVPQTPNIIAPRHSLLTGTPVRPRIRCSMSCPCLGGGSGRAWCAPPFGRRGGDQGGKEVEPLLGPAAGLGAVGDHRQARVGGDLHRLEGQLQLPHHRVPDQLGAAGVEADVVLGPERAELLAAGRQFADQLREPVVVGIAAGLAAQGGDGVAGDRRPVGEELDGARGEEDEAGGVDRPERVLEEGCVQGASLRVGGE